MWLGFDQNPLYALLHESIYCEASSESYNSTNTTFVPFYLTLASSNLN
jgi:hypothetical protein